MQATRLAALGTLALLSMVTRPLRSQTAADETAIRKVLADYAAALNKADASTAASLVSMNAELLESTGQLTRGRPAWQVFLTEALAGPAKGLQATFSISTIRFLRPDVAIGVVTGTETAPGQQPSHTTNILVFGKTAGKWIMEAGAGANTPPK